MWAVAIRMDSTLIGTGAGLFVHTLVFPLIYLTTFEAFFQRLIR